MSIFKIQVTDPIRQYFLVVNSEKRFISTKMAGVGD